MRVLAAKHLASDLALGVADGDTALGTLHEHDGRQHGGHEQHDDDREEDAHAAGLDEVHGLHDAARDAHHDTAEDDQGDAVADTAFSDLLTQPHDEHGTGREGGHGHHAEMPARIEHDGRAVGAGHGFEPDGDEQALHQGDQHGQVTGVLGYLAASGLAFFLGHALDVGAHHLQKLHDDGRRDVGHDTQSEDGHVGQAATGEHVEHVEQRSRQAFEVRGQGRGIHTGDGHMHTDSVAAQKEEGPAQALGQRRLSEGINRC